MTSTKILLSVSAFALHVYASLQCASTGHEFLSPNHQEPLCLDNDNTPGTPPILRVQHGKWSHKPFCVTRSMNTYCTHTTSDLRNGSGLSIIASPVAAKAISSAFPSSKDTRYVSEEGLEVRPIPGKGKGLISTRPIRKGQTILLDSPRIIASSEFPLKVGHAQGLSLLNKVLDQLPRQDRDLILSLDKSLGGTDIENVLKTNSFACQVSDGDARSGYMCLFPSVARINHACKPNSFGRFIPKSLLMEIKALRDIEPGEEISISYGKIELKYAERQHLYKDGWNFKCSCSLCMASAYEIEGSDQRRKRFKQLRDKLENLTSDTYDAEQIVGWEREVMEISKVEGLDVLLAEDYERLAYVYAGHGMLRDAKLWAETARQSLMEWTIVDGGPQTQIQRVEELLSELGG